MDKITGNSLTLDDIRTKMVDKKYKIETTCEFFPELNGTTITVLSAVLARNGEILIQCRNVKGRAFSIGANMKDLTFEEVA